MANTEQYDVEGRMRHGTAWIHDWLMGVSTIPWRVGQARANAESVLRVSPAPPPPAPAALRETTIRQCARIAASPSGHVSCDDPEMLARISDWRKAERDSIVSRILALSTKAKP